MAKLANAPHLKCDGETLEGSTPSIPTKLNIAWAAGLFEGEGTICLSKTKNRYGKIYKYYKVALYSTDFDVIKKFQSIVQLGTICVRPKKLNNKYCYVWTANSQKECLLIVRKLFWSYLCKRRRQQWLDTTKEIRIPNNMEVKP